MRKRQALQEKSRKVQRQYRERKKARLFLMLRYVPAYLYLLMQNACLSHIHHLGKCNVSCGMQAATTSRIMQTEQLKRQIEELTGRMSELMAERDTLQKRNSLLEKVVHVRSASDRLVQPQVSQCLTCASYCAIFCHCMQEISSLQANGLHDE